MKKKFLAEEKRYSNSTRTKQYVGRVIEGKFDAANRQLVVATEQNVLAALNIRTGQIQWRRVLEVEERGKIQFFDLYPESNSARYAITVTGTSLILVRSWDLRTGNLGREWTMNNPHAALNRRQHWYSSGTVLYHAILQPESSQMEVVSYDLESGDVLKTRSGPVHANENCHFAKNVLICTHDGKAVVTNIIDGKAQALVGSKQPLTIFKVSF